MNITPEYAAGVLQEYLRPTTFPVAVKLSGEEILPDRVRRPKALFGYPVTVCQGISMARCMGWTVGYLREDHACAPSFIVLGLAAEPPDLKMSTILHPLYGETEEACAVTQRFMATLPVGMVKSIAVAPLARADFEPDLVIVYGSPAQVTRLIHGALYRTGGEVVSSFIGRNSCVGELVVPFLEKKCQVVIPGSGERIFAHVQDHEMCFSFPWERMEDVVIGLQATHKSGAMRVPTPFLGIRTRPVFPEKYRALEEVFGIE